MDQSALKNRVHNPHRDSDLVPTRLRCEYLPHPFGLDTPKPRLSWNWQSSRRNERQTAYRVLVSSAPELLNRNRADLWDSGRVEADESIFIEYAGQPLRSGQACHWQVRVWNREGEPSAWSAPAFWSMGLLTEADWDASWISSNLELFDYQKKLRALPEFGMETEDDIWRNATAIKKLAEVVTEAPAVYLRKEFATGSKTVRRATAYVCGLGLCELHINGKRVGDHQLDPVYTDYEKRVPYLTYDVTTFLRSGANALGVVLGNGWFNLITPHVLRYYAAHYIATPRLRFRLDVEYADGSLQTIVSGPDWRFSTKGPIRFNCILGGETIDARNDLGAWAEPEYQARAWKPAIVTRGPRGKLVSQQLHPVRIVQDIPAASVEKDGEAWRFDFGMDLTGWVRIRLRGKPGQKITVRHPGASSHTLGRYQTEEYILCGKGEETFEPRFCYHGFRDVEVTGLDYEPAPADLTVRMVCTELPPVGEFSCSDDTLNKLYDVLLKTDRNYVVHLPNDPTREKAGWSQDIAATFDQMAYNFDSAAMYAKWQRDFLDIQHDNGYVPPVVPGRFDGPTINGPWWGGMIVYQPWKLYQYYGDQRILADSYPAMKRYLDYLGSIARNHIITWGLGDWLEVAADPSGRPTTTPVPLTSTCAYYLYATITAHTAELLHLPDEREQYRSLAERILTAFNSQFLDPATGKYAGGSQACQILPLHFGLVPNDIRPLAKQRLVEAIANAGGHVSTGFVATPFLLTALSDVGLGHLAFEMATQRTFPGWIDMVCNHGHTTMNENWNGGNVQMPSLAGAIGAWFFHSLAGIRPGRDSVAFKTLVIKPESAPTVDWVSARFQSPRGLIESRWRRQHGRLELSVTIPPNTTATVYVPASDAAAVSEDGRPAAESPGVRYLRQEEQWAVFTVGSGSYTFVSLTPGVKPPPISSEKLSHKR